MLEPLFSQVHSLKHSVSYKPLLFDFIENIRRNTLYAV